MWDRLPRYVKRVLVGLDEFVNILLNGRVGETISSRVGRNAIAGEFWSRRLFEPLIDAIFGMGHCRKNIESLQKDHE